MDATTRRAKYESLYNFLREEIAEGRYEVGDQLPTENQLCEMCQVSRTTIRLAVNQLVDEGVLSRQQGRGTFVVGKPKGARRRAEKTSDGLVYFKVISAGPVRSPPEISTMFGLPPDGEIYAIVRLRLLDGQPAAIKRYYAPIEVFAQDASKHDLEAKSFDIMLRERNLYIARTNLSAKPIFIGQEDGELLGVPKGTLGLFSQRIGYNEASRIIRVSETVLAAERATLHWTIKHPYGRVPTSEIVNFSDWMSNALD